MSYPADTRNTLASASSIASQCVQLPNSFIDSVNVQVEDVTRAAGDTVNITIPVVNKANVSDIGSGALDVKANATSVVPVQLANKRSNSRVVAAFDQTRSGIANLAQFFLAPMIEEVYQNINSTLAALVTPSNFNVVTSVTGGADTFAQSHLATAYSRLVAQGCPVQTPGMMSFVTHTTPWGNMLSSSDFIQESLVGANAAASARQYGLIAPQFGARVLGDPDVPQPTTGSVFAALLFHKAAITVRTAIEHSQADAVISETVITPKSIPVKIQMGNSIKDQGRVLHVSALTGHAVTRPEFGCYLVST